VGFTGKKLRSYPPFGPIEQLTAATENSKKARNVTRIRTFEPTSS